MKKYIIDNKGIKFKNKTINPFTEEMIGVEIKYNQEQNIQNGFIFYIGDVKYIINNEIL